MQQLSRQVIDELKAAGQLEFKVSEEKVYQRAFELVQENFDQESKLDQDVNKMMDDLEKQNPGEFQRYKMFPMLKKRLAKEKGFIL